MMNCALCGKDFPIHSIVDGKIKNLNKRKYCLECSPFGAHNTKSLASPARKNRAKIIELYCFFCKKKFIKKLKYFKDAQKRGQIEFFCNLSCAKKKIPVEVECQTCRNFFQLVPSAFGKSKSGFNYCSRKCATISNNTIYKSKENHPNWIDGKGSYRHGRELKKCSSCPETRYFLVTVHHKDGNRTNNSPDNLEDLCVACHVTRHLAVREGKLVVRWSKLTSPEAAVLLKSM